MTVNKLRHAMYKKRMKKYPNIPHTLSDLTRVLLQNPHISTTVDDEENLYAGSITALDGSHHVAFFSPRMLEHMGKVKTIQGDGTFRARPLFPLSSQCFVIVTTWNDCVSMNLLIRRHYNDQLLAVNMLFTTFLVFTISC